MAQDDSQKTSKDLRDMVFSLKPEELGINQENYPFPVWGTIMETGFDDEGYFTLVVLADGTVSFYLSNGGGIIGGGSHEAVRDRAGPFLIGSKDFYNKGKVTETTLPPNNNMVSFFFLTDDGIYSYSAKEEKLGEGRDSFSPLFHAGHAVISELRKIEQR